MSKELTLGVYKVIGWWAIGIGVAVLAVSPIVKRWMHLETLKDEDLAGRDQLAENQGPGMHPERETKPGPQEA